MRTKPTTRAQLDAAIKTCLQKYGPLCSLNHIDVSGIENMDELFKKSTFNGDISEWNVSNVKSMGYMFFDSHFNGDISRWDVSNVEQMYWMFAHSSFRGDISKWNVGRVKNMNAMFSGSQFTGDLSAWNVADVQEMAEMFSPSDFNGDISKWNVAQVYNFRGIFKDCLFQGDLSQWCFHPRADLTEPWPLGRWSRTSPPPANTMLWMQTLQARSCEVLAPWPQWEKHFVESMPLIDTMGLRWLPAAKMLQTLWMQKQCDFVPEQLDLPALE